MLNHIPYNVGQFNGFNQVSDLVEAQDNIVFNGFSFQNINAITSKVLYDEMPIRKVRTFDIPREHGQKIVTDFYRTKRIRMVGVLRAASKEELNTKIDQMKLALSKRNSVLDIKINGVVRRFIATCETETIFDRDYFHVTFVRYDFVLSVYSSFGSDVSFTSSSLLDQSQLNFTKQVENTGTADTKPFIHVLFKSVDAITSIAITNNATGERMTVTENFSDGDILTIDSDTKTVMLNGSRNRFLGVFFDLLTGLNDLVFELEGTSATINVTTRYTRKFL